MSASTKRTTKAKSTRSTARKTAARPSVNKDARIKVLASGNPRKKGTAGYDSFNVYLTKGVRTVRDYLGYEGAGMSHLKWDVSHGFVKLEGSSGRSAH